MLFVFRKTSISRDNFLRIELFFFSRFYALISTCHILSKFWKMEQPMNIQNDKILLKHNSWHYKAYMNHNAWNIFFENLHPPKNRVFWDRYLFSITFLNFGVAMINFLKIRSCYLMRFFFFKTIFFKEKLLF